MVAYFDFYQIIQHFTLNYHAKISELKNKHHYFTIFSLKSKFDDVTKLSATVLDVHKSTVNSTRRSFVVVLVRSIYML